MRAGTLRHRITIERPRDVAPDEYGEPAPAEWETFVTLWGGIEPVAAREAEFAKGFAATVSHKMTLRYNADIRPTDRISFRGRILVINGIVNVDERNRELTLYCTETPQ